MAQVMRPEREEEIMAQVGEEIKAADGSGGSGSSDAAGIGHITIDLIKKTDGHSDFKLGRFLEEPDSHKFRCPNCAMLASKILMSFLGRTGPPPPNLDDPPKLPNMRILQQLFWFS
ncbi:hypothetical protein CK203_108829 [Vitis vinifera]|uniref:Uncharacterized protein n=1 Tax=Vitis vinifera TaxID=29760 RepID=A0A438CE31_VITVI|nr:hypothetical protein CK203_108829 [Vitis vinifera]